MLKIIFGIKIIVLFNLAYCYSQNSTDSTTRTSFEHKIIVGEEYTYIVKYAFLNLGEVKTKVFAKERLDGKTIYKAMAYIDSYEGLPIVDLHQTYESWFDSTLHPVYFQTLAFEETDTSYTNYFFYEDSIIHVIKGTLNNSQPVLDTTVTVNGKFYDGLSLLYSARYNFDKLDSIDLQCYVSEDTSSTAINYYHDSEEISIEAVGHPIGCRRLDGESSFTGVYGLTGYFEGWFSDDEQRVPITADLQVMIGNVKVELIEWNNDQWQPPVYKE
ncbi:MAG: DUF3108 domain-containing protein [Ignavibacterium sp.]|nr:MAG: DUF3108 domain-containing protein [Ignavibacterium sp.]